MQFYGYIAPKLELVNMKIDFLNRNVNEGFSGGERKRNEIMQLVVYHAPYLSFSNHDHDINVYVARLLFNEYPI